MGALKGQQLPAQGNTLGYWGNSPNNNFEND